MASLPPSESPDSASASTPDAIQSWLSVVRAYNLCEAVMTQRLSDLGLRLGDHEVLVNLLRSPGLTQQQLAQRCFVAKSGVSMLVSRMEQTDLLLRHNDPLDARVKRLFLTPAGQVLAEKAQLMQMEVVSAMAQQSTAVELKAISDVMLRASAALERML